MSQSHGDRDRYQSLRLLSQPEAVAAIIETAINGVS
jgi:hypothetical protein